MSDIKPKQGLAVTSFVLGLLSLVCLLMFVTGIPAIITGHLARSRARRLPGQYGGARFAMAGLITGYLGTSLALGIAIFIAIMVPRVNRMQADFAVDRCVSNLKQIGLAARVFSEANKYRFPESFQQMSNELGSPYVLRCPADTNRVARVGSGVWNEVVITYEFLEPGLQESPDAMGKVVFRCPIHGHVVTADGTVQAAPSPASPGTNQKP